MVIANCKWYDWNRSLIYGANLQVLSFLSLQCESQYDHLGKIYDATFDSKIEMKDILYKLN